MDLYRKTPLMGWASWNYCRTNISEEKMKVQMDALISTGLFDCGYEYANLDDGFFGGRDENGRLLFNKERFPNGIKVLADYAHSLGLKAGIYSEGGDNTCGFLYDNEGANGTGVGLYGHEEQDLNMFLDEFGFDFIKVDWCGGLRLGLDEETQYTKIGKIIDEIRHRTNRQLVFNVCRWQFPGAWVVNVADSWRTGADINPNFPSVMYQVDSIKALARYCGPGHVNDLDMMQIGNGLTLTEEKTHFSMWCMMSTPLMLGCDLTKLSEETLNIIKNKELIAIDQDEACLQAFPIKDWHSEKGKLLAEIWIKDLGKKYSNKKAIAFVNRSTESITLDLKAEEAGLIGKILSVRDLWKHEEVACTNEFHVTVEAHDVVVYKVESESSVEVVNRWDQGEVEFVATNKISMETAMELVKEGAMLIDVRSTEEYEQKHLEGALNYPYSVLDGFGDVAVPDKNTTIVVYCSTGKRSSQAKNLLETNGFDNVYYLGGVEEL